MDFHHVVQALPPWRQGPAHSLWAGRYKNTVLDSGRALWKCIQYVELNPLRAKMVRDLRDYRFSSFGEYCGKGTHPFAENITKHLCGEGRRFDSLEAFMTRLQEIFCAVSNIIFRDEINPDDKELVTLARRCRYWCDSGIIGSEIFVREVMSRFYDEKAAARRRLTQFTTGIFSLRQLKTK